MNWKRYMLILAYAFLFFSGCAGASRQLTVKRGDRVQVDFTCRLCDGGIVATTSQDIARDDSAYPKAPIFLRQTEYAPLSLMIGDEMLTGGGQNPDSIDSQVSSALSSLLEGVEVGREYTFRIDANINTGMKDNERFLKMARVRNRPKQKRMSRELFMRFSKGTEPKEGLMVELEPGFSGRVLSVNETEVAMAVELESGNEVPVPPLGIGMATDKGDHFEIEIKAHTGDLIRVGAYVGRITEITGKTIIADFGHPFGGERLACDVVVEAAEGPHTAVDAAAKVEGPKETAEDPEAVVDISGEPQHKEPAEGVLKDALSEALQSEKGSVDIDLERVPEDPEIIQKGDMVWVNYTVTAEGGEVFNTTYESLAHDPSIKKFSGYKEPKEFSPEVLIIGDQSVPSLMNEALPGMKVNEKKGVTIAWDDFFSPYDKNKIKEYPRIRRMSRKSAMSAKEYTKRYNSFPAAGSIVPLNPYINATIGEVTKDQVVLEAIAEEGKRIEDELGTTEITLDGDDVVLTLNPSIGAPFEHEDQQGKVVRTEEKVFVVDFNHPLAGKRMTLDMEVVSLTKASHFRDREIPWIEEHDIGIEASAHENKPLLILLYAGWCQWSKRMMLETLQHPLIKAIEDEFVWLKIDSSEHKEYFERYNQGSYPTVVVMNPHSETIKRIDGFIDAKSLRRELDLCLKATLNPSS